MAVLIRIRAASLFTNPLIPVTLAQQVIVDFIFIWLIVRLVHLAERSRL
jgi:hypothetical protein